METPIATIFMFDWTTEYVTELVSVLIDMEDEFVAATSDVKSEVGSN
jgi:hypothetical protein